MTKNIIKREYIKNSNDGLVYQTVILDIKNLQIKAKKYFKIKYNIELNLL